MINKLMDACKGMSDDDINDVMQYVSGKKKKSNKLPDYLTNGGDASQYGTRARLPEYMDDDARIAMY